MLQEGQQFAHYRIVRRLKSGGMGEIYLAYDLQLYRYVAIKVIRTDSSYYPDADAEQEAARLFLREMQAIGQLDHRHILPVYDSGEETDDGTILMYMVMPFRREGSLFDWLRRRGRPRVLSPRDVESIVKQAASALQYAHNHHIVHQDVKPSNFLIYGQAEHPGQLNLQLADFGVAKFMTRTSESLTIRGTPIYMAPEQWEGYPSPTTDQYALAVMAYELLTGRLPFVGSNHEELWHQHHHVQPQRPSTINPRIPRELDAVLLRALSKNPEDRFKSVSAFARAFRQAIFNINPLNPAEGNDPFVAAPTIEPTVPVRNDLVANPPPRRSILTRRAFFQFGIVLAFIATSFGLFFFFSRNPQAPTYNTNNAGINNMHTTSANTAIAEVNTTASTLANTTSTTQSNVTASTTDQTAIANETATAQANATATALANATATALAASAYATATAYATNVIIGTPILDDPLQGNSKGNNWDITPIASGSGCVFTGGVYHSAISQNGYISTCFAQATNFSNFSYQVQMRIVAGDQGGIAFRADSGKGSFYYFYINRNGAYALETYGSYILSKIISRGPSPAIKTGLNQPNLLAVVANNNTINLYVNMQFIVSVSDNSFYQGQIGVVAEDTGNPADIVFTDAKIWTP
jgi:serine/threonine protein kinase